MYTLTEILGSQSATDNTLRCLREKTLQFEGCENALLEPGKVGQIESAVRQLVEEVSTVQQTLTGNNSAGLKSKKGIVGALSPMVDAVQKAKISTQPKQVHSSYRIVGNNILHMFIRTVQG